MTSGIWRLPDSSGRNEFRAAVVQVTDQDGRPRFKISFSISGMFWNRIESSSKTIADVDLAVSQLLVDRTHLVELLAALDEWLQSHKAFSSHLSADGDDQSLEFEVSSSELRVSSAERPACIITYRGSVLNLAQFILVVDQSCLRIFRDSLAAILHPWRYEDAALH